MNPSIVITWTEDLLLGCIGVGIIKGALSMGIDSPEGVCWTSAWNIGWAGDWVIYWSITISWFKIGGDTWSDKDGYIPGVWNV